MTDLPANVYRVRQRDFTAIPREPWVYWIPDDIRKIFNDLPSISSILSWKRGCTTSDNFRFIRSWWEVGPDRFDRSHHSLQEARESPCTWFPYTKTPSYRRWYGPTLEVVNWADDGAEMKAEIVHRYSYLNGNWEWVAKNSDHYFKPGITHSSISSTRFSSRYLVGGAIFDQSANAVFLDDKGDILSTLGVLNSSFADWVIQLNPTINVVKDDLMRMPFPSSKVNPGLVRSAIHIIKARITSVEETTRDFIILPDWSGGLRELISGQKWLADLEAQIDDEVYRLYGISDADRAAIEAELAGEPPPTDEDEIEAILNDDDDGEIEPPMDREELAVRWISYAVGVVLGRFRVGAIDETSIDETEIVNRQSKIGNGIYRREDFAVGSLPAPDEAEFDQLVGPPERFAYVDEDGGRHVFPAEVESALCARAVGDGVAVDDGITVLDEGHPRDLPTLVRQALTLMLGDEAAQEVIGEGAGGDLRQFLTKDFFTDWHIKWYSIPYQAKAPVYWPLQSADRSYGFVLFHETIDKTTLYVLQRDYLDYKLNGLRQRIDDLTARMEGLEGSAQKRVARQIQGLNETLEEIEEFAKTMARIVREGYEPEPNWIDDRVILRMAPLWELIPLWEKHPKKHWKRLREGEYDWSHIAMNYWPERVREACKENKSYAIAHGHPEWYEGGEG